MAAFNVFKGCDGQRRDPRSAIQQSGWPVCQSGDPGSALILADDTFAAASHAAEQGWIHKDALEAVHEEKRADEGVSGEKADVPGVPEEPKAPTVVVE